MGPVSPILGAAMWPVALSIDNINNIRNPYYLYYVIPRPNGTRYFLYVDLSGKMFLRSMKQQLFRVDESHANEIICKDTILDGVFTREKVINSPDNVGKLTFVIHDAIRCGGVDLTDFNIRKRLDFIQDVIMDKLKGKLGDEKQSFNLDIVEPKEFQLACDYLSEEFEDSFKYPLYSLIFIPRECGYLSGTRYTVFQWTGKCFLSCSFRLKIHKDCNSKPTHGDLNMVGCRGYEFHFSPIKLTDELRELDGRIIDCRLVNDLWVFHKLRPDRQYPNGRNLVMSKLYNMKNPVLRYHVLAALEKSEANHA